MESGISRIFMGCRIRPQWHPKASSFPLYFAVFRIICLCVYVVCDCLCVCVCVCLSQNAVCVTVCLCVYVCVRLEMLRVWPFVHGRACVCVCLWMLCMWPLVSVRMCMSANFGCATVCACARVIGDFPCGCPVSSATPQRAGLHVVQSWKPQIWKLPDMPTGLRSNLCWAKKPSRPCFSWALIGKCSFLCTHALWLEHHSTDKPPD